MLKNTTKLKDWIPFINSLETEKASKSEIPLFDGITIKENEGVYGVQEYKGATDIAPGIAGLVPPASQQKRNAFLRGDGEWVDIIETNRTFDICSLSTDKKDVYNQMSYSAPVTHITYQDHSGNIYIPEDKMVVLSDKKGLVKKGGLYLLNCYTLIDRINSDIDILVSINYRHNNVLYTTNGETINVNNLLINDCCNFTTFTYLNENDTIWVNINSPVNSSYHIETSYLFMLRLC